MLIKGKHISLDMIERVLLIQLGDIGDVVLTTPTLKALKENRPPRKLSILLREHSGALMKACPWVDQVFSIQKAQRGLCEEIAYQKEFISMLRREKFGLAVDLRTGTRGAILSFVSGARLRIGRYADDGAFWRNRLFTHLVRPENELHQYSTLHNGNILAPFGLNLENPSPELVITQDIKSRAARILRSEGIPTDRPIIALHPFSRWKYKEWPIWNYAPLMDHIRSRKRCSIVITGSSEEIRRIEELDLGDRSDVYPLVGKTSIDELPGVLERCLLLIGIDSASIHIAAAVGTPTLTIFGPSSPTSWAPRGKEHDIVFKDLPCVPCRQKGCQNSGFSRCLDELNVAEVIPMLNARLSSLDSLPNGSKPARPEKDHLPL